MDEDEDFFRFEIIDAQIIYGLPMINREECRLNGVYDFSYGLPPNSSLLLPSMSAMHNNETIRVHL